MTAVLSRWGNSLAIRIPSAVAQLANFSEGDKLDLQVSKHGRVTLVAQPKEVDFGALYDAITAENRYEAVSEGPARGNESVVW
jgi:antitoxin MazE